MRRPRDAAGAGGSGGAKPSRLTIRALIVGPHLVLSLAGLAVVTAVATTLMVEEIRAATRARHVETGRTLAGFPLAHPSTLENVERLVGADVATIDFEGRVLHSTLAPEAAGDLDRWLAANPDAVGSGAEPRPVALAGARTWFFYSPVPDEEAGRIPYQGLALLVPDEAFEARWEPAVRRVVAIGAVTLVLVLAVGWTLGAWIARPLARLAGRADRIAGGDLSSRIEPRGAAEVARLADAFNRMVDGLVESRSRLAEAERLAALGRLAASLAHEVRNPLTSIRMTVERVRERTAEDETRSALHLVQADIARLERTAEDLLYSARPSPPVLETVDLGRLLDDLVALFARQLAHREIEVRTAWPSGPVLARADPRRMKQLFMNLLLNAIAAVGSGGRIDLELAIAGDLVRATIRDTGPGVPPAERERIFEPFVTLREGGTGLGLAVSRRIVEDHGGRIACTGDPPGAQFVVELPAG